MRLVNVGKGFPLIFGGISQPVERYSPFPTSRLVQWERFGLPDVNGRLHQAKLCRVL
jgi:hypothetical protein